MKIERIYLNEEDKRSYIDAYIQDGDVKRDAMLVIPGGGYVNVCTEREGEPIALAFLGRGLNCFVLNYRVGQPGDVYPKQMIDAGSAMIYIKNNAERFMINKERVFAVGFSAGGHLAGSIATMYDYPEIREYFGEDYKKVRPTGAILAYPVTNSTLPEGQTHPGSFLNLLGRSSYDEITEEERERFSLSHAVNADSAPMFVWHTAEDELVPPIGSLDLAASLVKAGVPAKISIYPYGPHGVALANAVTRCGNKAFVQPTAERWVDDAVEFMKTLADY